MIQGFRKEEADVVTIRFVGSIEERVDFDELIGFPPLELHLNCKEVDRINSYGVRLWMKYFEKARASGTKIVFRECSVPIVEIVLSGLVRHSEGDNLR